ncbi:MAG: histidine kinase [Acidobacteria bacterium]|nr:histidine kinase [Acidobacteriota bacterium]
MHPILVRLERLAGYVGLWVAIGLVLSLWVARQGHDTVDALIVVLPTFVAYGFVCLSAWYVCHAVPVTRSSVPAVAVSSVVSGLCGGVLWYTLARGWLALLRQLTPGQPFGGAEAEQLLLFGVAFGLYLLSLAVCHVAVAYDAAREADAQRLEYQVLTREAELRALRAQLNPHFLYNSLNSISALTTSDPAGARRMCVLLGDFLRNTLKVSALDRVTLSQELTLVDAFLAIEQVRFGTRLSLVREIDPAALACRVPPLMLQPLMENAIVHGIADLLDGGTITITVTREGERILLRIENPRDPDVAPRRHGGVGLENVRRRVQTAFGDRARFDATSETGHFRVDLNLPVEEI